jgi:hypothetical protein
MIKHALKYLTIGLANMAILTILLALWTDDLELNFHTFVRATEFLKILAVTFFSLVSVGVYLFYLRKRDVKHITAKIKGAVVLTVLLSSYLYITYSDRVVSNVIVNRHFREKLAAKIKPSTKLANGTEAAGLTIKEYQLVAALAELPPIPQTASNIAYQYAFDGFLPDYSLSISYDVPLQTPIATYDSSKGRYLRRQSVSVVGNVVRVAYGESRW